MATVTLEDVPFKETKRAQRRHDVERLKAVRSRHLVVAGRHGEYKPTDRVVGIHVNTAAVCSCAACGNPRKFNGERTVQEQRLLQRYRPGRGSNA